MTIPYTTTVQIDLLPVVQFVGSNFLLPIIVAFAAYVVADRHGEWRKRRMYSRLGVAIIESLQEEVQNGIKEMEQLLASARGPIHLFPRWNPLPTASWSGMATIPDEVLLRIIETSQGQTFDGFHPQQCRIHCKNYFVHMSGTYDQTRDQAAEGYRMSSFYNWREDIINLLADDRSGYLAAAQKVYDMLEDAKLLLVANAKARRPK